MKLVLVAVVALLVEHTVGQGCIDDGQQDINCTEVYIEYDREWARCQEIFVPCIVQSRPASCSTSEFCSDECRSIYRKVLLCNNRTTDLLHLEFLDLYCAASNGSLHQGWRCLDFVINSSGDLEYGYRAYCFMEVILELTEPCSDGCRKALTSYRNECCSNNVVVAKKFVDLAGQDKENLISLYSERLWKHCELESPRMCPAPACPTSPPPPPPGLADVGAVKESRGVSKHGHVNWFILLMILFYYL